MNASRFLLEFEANAGLSFPDAIREETSDE